MNETKRVFLEKNLLANFFKLVKESKNFVSWTKLREEINIGNTTLKSYRRGKLTMPYNLFLRLLNYLKENDADFLMKNIKLRDANWGSKKAGIIANSKLTQYQINQKMAKVRAYIKSSTYRNNPCPSLDNLEACEFFGSMLGDGTLAYFKNEGRMRWEARLVGNAKKDRDYLEYMANLIKKLFNSKAKVYTRKCDNCLQLATRKRSVGKWLNKNGYPLGRKSKNFSIPENITKLPIQNINKVIRGLLDTDGHVNARKDEDYKYPYITISSNSPALRDQLKELLRKQGFPAFIHSNAISVRGIKSFYKWFNVIGSSNPRILKKYEDFCNTGKIIPG